MNKLAILGGIGVLGAGAAGTAGVTGTFPFQENGETLVQQVAGTPAEREFPPLLQKQDGQQSRAEQAAAEAENAPEGRDAILFCLTWHDDGTTCLTRKELLARAGEPLTKQRVALSASGRPENVAEIPMRVKLADPVDFKAPEEEVRDCAAFNDMKSKGWGALTSADMVDEQWFMVRCGLYKMAAMADVPASTEFEQGRLSTDDLKAVGEEAWPYLGEKPEGDPGMALRKPASANTLENSDRFWVARYGNMQTLVSEVSHADFNGDGSGDVLVLINASPREKGTAQISYYGLLEKVDGSTTMTEASVY